MKYPSSRVLTLFVFSIFLFAGCEGDDGSTGATGATGATGPAGPPGPGVTIDIGNADEINAVTNSVSVSSPPVVQFTLTDENGSGLTGLPASSISFTISKLVPGVNGEASEWQSYVTRIESAGPPGPGTEDEVQASTENGSAGALMDLGNGSYSYTFATDLDNASVPFDASMTHRVGFEIRGFAETDGNGAYTFRPSDGATSGLFSREIVDTATCNTCHDKLSLHGGARFDAQYCMTCHNPGSVDANSTNTVDAKVMIHKIHRGEDLPSVIAGTPYVIYGFFNSLHDYSEVIFPQDIRNCRNCHDENNPDTPDAGNWLTVPTMEACGSCHDDVDFETGLGHSMANLAATNADCAICHSTGGFVGPIDDSHEILLQTAAENYQYNIESISNTAPGDFPSVVISVTDPNNNDEPYDILNDDPFIQGFGASRVAVDIGWDTRDYSNTGSGSADAVSGAPAQPISLNPLFGGSSPNADNSMFTVTSTTMIPANATGSGVVAIEGHPAEDVDGDGSVDRLAVTGATDFFTITDTNPVPRRHVVDIDNCNGCHQQLSLHGSNRTDNIDLCLTCHNSDGTDIRQRDNAGVDASTAPDGKDEEIIAFKYMIHAIHAGEERENGILVYGFGGNPHDYSDVIFPGHLNNCRTCHDGDTFYPGANALAVTNDTGADRSDPLDDLNITPDTAACAACHDSDLAAEHMKQNGGAFDAMQQADGTLISVSAGTVVETCTICHAEDRTADVAEVHDID